MIREENDYEYCEQIYLLLIGALGTKFVQFKEVLFQIYALMESSSLKEKGFKLKHVKEGACFFLRNHWLENFIKEATLKTSHPDLIEKNINENLVSLIDSIESGVLGKRFSIGFDDAIIRIENETATKVISLETMNRVFWHIASKNLGTLLAVIAENNNHKKFDLLVDFISKKENPARIFKRFVFGIFQQDNDWMLGYLVSVMGHEKVGITSAQLDKFVKQHISGYQSCNGGANSPFYKKWQEYKLAFDEKNRLQNIVAEAKSVKRVKHF